MLFTKVHLYFTTCFRHKQRSFTVDEEDEEDYCDDDEYNVDDTDNDENVVHHDHEPTDHDQQSLDVATTTGIGSVTTDATASTDSRVITRESFHADNLLGIKPSPIHSSNRVDNSNSVQVTTPFHTFVSPPNASWCPAADKEAKWSQDPQKVEEASTTEYSSSSSGNSDYESSLPPKQATTTHNAEETSLLDAVVGDGIWMPPTSSPSFVQERDSSLEQQDDEDEDYYEDEHILATGQSTPVPTLIEFRSSLEETRRSHYNESWIFDPVDSLIQGRLPLDPDDPVQIAANELERCLEALLEAEDSNTVVDATQKASRIFCRHPEVARICYHLGNSSNNKTPNHITEDTILSALMPCHPITFLTVMGNLQGVQAAYTAYPEAIGIVDHYLGTPLHYACYCCTHTDSNSEDNDQNNDDFSLVRFLLSKYPEATHTINDFAQTPLHLACSCNNLNLPIIQLLLETFPTAARIADSDGCTPLHLALSQGVHCTVDIVQALMRSSSSPSEIVRACTRRMEKPLHIAARCHVPLETIHFILQQDPSQGAYIDEDFQTSLHKAVLSPTVSIDLVRLLLSANIHAKQCLDIRNETPYDLAVRMESASPAVLDLLLH